MLVRVLMSVTVFLMTSQILYSAAQFVLPSATKDDQMRDLANVTGRIYYVSVEMATDVKRAWNLCSEINFQLAGLETLEEAQELGDYITNVLQHRDRVYYTSGLKVYLNWTWSNSGRSLTFDLWAPGEPSQGSVGQACIFLQNGELYDSSCTEPLYFICEKSECL